MKRVLWLLTLALLLPSLVWAQDDRERRGEDRGDGNYHQSRPARVRPNRVRSAPRAANVHVSPQFHSMGVRSYPKVMARGKLMIDTNRAHANIMMPNRGPNGMAIHANLIARTNFSSNPVVRAHMNLVMGANFRANIVGFSAHETLVNHYYWHTYGGFNFCHYYDPYGYHWYGWYLGNSYFWTRWYNNHYWWYDPVYYRWCYWHDGGWWWQDPDTTTIYVYNNGNYVSSSGTPSASAQAPAANVKSADFFSPDSSREVRVLAGGDAFLYDISGANAFKPIFLASGVTDVKFSNNGDLQVLLMLKDGTFSTFDGNGNSLSGNGGGNSAAPMNVPDNSGQGAPQQPPSGSNPPAAPPGTNS